VINNLTVCYYEHTLANMEINVLIDKELEGKLEPAWLRKIAEQVLTLLVAGNNAELGLFITSEERIRQLNRDYLGREEPTDVLAFSAREGVEDLPPFVPPPDGVLHLGEVIISYPQAVIQAEEYKHSVEREILILVIHGVLHLMGYKDDTPEFELAMRAREAMVLSQIGGPK
jgi:probable rRNA maturation factor